LLGFKNITKNFETGGVALFFSLLFFSFRKNKRGKKERN
jgi:hypothetical protein